MNLYWRLFKYVNPFLLRVIVAVVCMALASAANLYIPWVCKDMIDKVLLGKNYLMLNIIALSILAVVFSRGFFTFVNTYQISYAGYSVVKVLRSALYGHIQKQSLAYFGSQRTGRLMGIFINDVGVLQTTVVNELVDFVTEAIVLIGSLAVMFYLNWKLSLITIMLVPFAVGIIRGFGKKIKKTGREIQESIGDVTAVLEEAVSGVKVIQSFTREEYFTQRFDEQIRRNFSGQMKATRLASSLTPIIECFAAFFATFVIWYGGREVINGNMTPGELIAFLFYVVNLGNPVRKLTRVYSDIQRGLAAAQRVFEVVDTPMDIADDSQAYDLPQVQGQVIFDKVSFSYRRHEGAQPTIEKFSLVVQPGEVVALVGESGAGKTTITDLLLRFYEVCAGTIAIDGHDIRRVTMKSLRGQIGLVSQDTILFNDTIMNNILYGRPDASREEVIAAARAANAHEFIDSFPRGYETRLADMGRNLSGGQRQRIAIARTFLKNPRIMVLDEATSALDSENEQAVQEAMDVLMRGRTVFIIAHRLSTVQKANKVIVMSRGQIIEQGSHTELLAAEGAYARLWALSGKTNAAVEGECS